MIIDFSECKTSDRHGMYGGQAGDKDGILYNDECWIVKFPKSTKGMNGNNLPSYTTSPLSEFLGSHIYQILGYDAHETLLGERNNKIVVACKDFCKPFEILMEIRAVKNSANKEIQEAFGDDNVPKSATGDAVNLEELQMHFKVNPLMKSSDVINRFWECAIVDIFIDNNDRNNGNWGILKDGITKQNRLAPIYDNGNSFNNKLSEEQVRNKLALSWDEKIAFATGTRTSYSKNDHLLSPSKFLKLDDPNLKVAIKNVVPKIKNNLDRIADFIDSIPEKYNGKIVFSNERKRLYKDLLNIRYEKLLAPAYEKEMGVHNDKELLVSDLSRNDLEQIKETGEVKFPAKSLSSATATALSNTSGSGSNNVQNSTLALQSNRQTSNLHLSGQAADTIALALPADPPLMLDMNKLINSIENLNEKITNVIRSISDSFKQSHSPKMSVQEQFPQSHTSFNFPPLKETPPEEHMPVKETSDEKTSLLAELKPTGSAQKEANARNDARAAKCKDKTRNKDQSL